MSENAEHCAPGVKTIIVETLNFSNSHLYFVNLKFCKCHICGEVNGIFCYVLCDLDVKFSTQAATPYRGFCDDGTAVLYLSIGAIIGPIRV